MLDVGLLDKNKVGSLDDVIEKRAYFQFYMHRTGHWLGMDVHDCGGYTEPSRDRPGQRAQGRAHRRDHQGPPGAHPAPRHGADHRARHLCAPGEGVPEQFHNIGIRIEDDAIVTDDRLRTDQPRCAGERGRD